MSICTDNAQALNCTAILMQQVGSTSKYSIQLVQGIVNDFFVLVPNALEKFKEIPKNAPLFAANFLTAVAELYYVNKGMIISVFTDIFEYSCNVETRIPMIYRGI